MKRLASIACVALASCAEQHVTPAANSYDNCISSSSCGIWIRTPTGKAPTKEEMLEARIRQCYARLSPDDVNDQRYSYPPPKLAACMAVFGWHYEWMSSTRTVN